MSMVYLRQELERAILRNADPDDGVGEVINEMLEEDLIERGWLEPDDNRAGETEA